LYGCDLSPRLCEIARRQVPEATIAVENGERLDGYDDAMFDVAYMICSLSNMQRHADALAAANRVLVPGGRLGIVVPNREWIRYDRWLRHHTQLQPVDDYFFLPSEISGLLTAAGFMVGPPRGIWAMYRADWRHRLELALAAVAPLLHRKMKCIGFRCVKA
jgi:SAM-dependent methyltransferase